MSIIVEAGDGHAWRSLCVLAEADLTMSYAHQLKSAVEALIGIPAERQHLFLGRKKITDTLSLADQGLHPGAVVRLQIPLLAGNPGSIKVSGLDPNVTKADLDTAFEDYGDIKSVKLIHSKGRSKPNHCFINFATLQDAKSAIAGMQGRVIGQQRIHCTLQQQQIQSPSSSSVVYHPVKVGNLSDSVTVSMLRQAFGKAGTILDIKLIHGDQPYAFVNYENEADAQRAVSRFHHRMVCGVKVNVIARPQRTVSKAGSTPPVRSASASITTSTTPRRIPHPGHAAASHSAAAAVQHSPQQAIGMVSENMGLSRRQLETAIEWQGSGKLKTIQGDGKLSLRRKDKVLVCEASTAAIAKKQLGLAKRLLERPDQGCARINLSDRQRKFMEARQRQYVQGLRSDHQVQISLDNFILIVGPQYDVDTVEDELRCYVGDLVTHEVPVKRHFKLERPLAAKYQQIKKEMEQRRNDVYLEVPSMDQLRGNAARGPRGASAAFCQDCTVLCVATHQSDLDDAIQKIKQVDKAVGQLRHPISSQDGDILKAGMKSDRIDVAAFNANIDIQPDHVHITALSASDVHKAKRAVEVYLESEKDGQSTFYFSSAAVGRLVLAFHMDKVSRIAQTHSVKVDVPKVPAVTSQSPALHISGKVASVKQCIVDLNKWQSTLHADKSSCKVTGLTATALPECQVDIDELAKQQEVLCDLNEPLEQLTMALRRARVSRVRHEVPKEAFSAKAWLWMDDDGWKPYDQPTCQTLTNAQARGTRCRLKLQGTSYIVDPIKMKQENEATGHKRNIRCLDPSGSTESCVGSTSSYKWQFHHEDGHFADYLLSDSSKIEKAYLSGKTSLDLLVGKWTYTIYARQGFQVNTMTDTQRPIRRVSVQRASASTVAASDAGMSLPFKFSPCLSVEINLLASTLMPNTSPTYLMAPAKAPSNFLSDLGHRLEQALEKKKIDVPPGFNADIQDELKRVAQSQLVCIEYRNEGVSKTFVVTGSKKGVLEAAIQVQGLILKNVESVGSAEAVSFPKKWKLPCEDLELVPVRSSSYEFAEIQDRIQETLPSVLIELRRIQNKFLWRKFEKNRQEIREVNGRSTTPEEKLLFHGTSQTAPEEICRDQEGFDMRFSASGLWGRANYFAEDAAYSHGYSHQPVAGMKQRRQMLLALVTIGKSKELEQDRQLTRPPIRIPQVHGNILYDTVNGITNQRRVYMTYNNRQAYPFYLITYRLP